MSEIFYPENLDEQRINELVSGLIDQIDRERFASDPGMPVLQHPLILERVGQARAVDNEIRNILLNRVMAQTTADDYSNADDVRNQSVLGMEAMSNNAVDSGCFEQAENDFDFMVEALKKANPGNAEAASKMVAPLLYRKLETLTPFQNLIIYPAANYELYGETAANVMKAVRQCREDLLRWALDAKTPEEKAARKSEIDAEVQAVVKHLRSLTRAGSRQAMSSADALTE